MLLLYLKTFFVLSIFTSVFILLRDGMWMWGFLSRLNLKYPSEASVIVSSDNRFHVIANAQSFRSKFLKNELIRTNDICTNFLKHFGCQKKFQWNFKKLDLLPWAFRRFKTHVDETKPMILLGIDTPHVVDHKTLSKIIMGLSYSMYLVLLEANGRRSIFLKKK